MPLITPISATEYYINIIIIILNTQDVSGEFAVYKGEFAGKMIESISFRMGQFRRSRWIRILVQSAKIC